MIDELQPALSAEEWKHLEIPFAGNIYQERMLGVFEEDGWRYKMAKVIALANAGMPNDSPYKITREAVAYLGDAIAALENGWVGRDSLKLGQLQSALLALLPPETSSEESP